MSRQDSRTTEASAVARILDPDSVAVVGASKDESKRGYLTLERLREWGYRGEVYPVNPKYAGESIEGYEVYPSLSAIPGPVDVALIVTPSHTVPGILEGASGVDLGGAVVVPAGFDEVGHEDRTKRLLEVAHENGIRLVGPNTNGLINVHERLDLVGEEIPPGGLALLAQSGNIASQLVAEALARGDVGFSFYISIGNEADLRFHEFLPFLRDHEETDVVVCYVEGMAEGREFLRTAAGFVREKPIVALKGGRTDAGKESAESHTASIAGSGRVVDAVYRQAGVVGVDRMDELLAVSDALASLPPAQGRNVAVLSDGGGHATHVADVLAERGLNVPDLEPETQRRIRELVPDQAPNVANPVDVLTFEYDVGTLYECADLILQDPNVDALILCGYFGGYGRFDEESVEQEVSVAERLSDLPRKYGKPVVAQSMFASLGASALDTLRETPIPVSESLNVAASEIVALAEYGAHLAVADRKSDFVLETDEPPSAVVERAVADGRTRLSEHEARRALAEYDAPVVPAELATSDDGATRATERFDGPVAMKAVSPDILHKTEADCVALDVEDGEAGATFDRLVANATAHDPDADVDGVLVSPMVEEGVELVVGVTRDEEVGPVVMFGLGGVLVEALDDVTFRGLPLTEYDARSMLDDVAGSDVLDGVRGNPPVDRDAVVDLLCTVSAFATANPAVEELDLNPVVATDEGVTILDAAVTLSE